MSLARVPPRKRAATARLVAVPSAAREIGDRRGGRIAGRVIGIGMRADMGRRGSTPRDAEARASSASNTTRMTSTTAIEIGAPITEVLEMVIDTTISTSTMTGISSSTTKMDVPSATRLFIAVVHRGVPGWQALQDRWGQEDRGKASEDQAVPARVRWDRHQAPPWEA